MKRADTPYQLTKLHSYITLPHACGYFEDKWASYQVVTPTDAVNAAHYSELIRLGFRRSGLFVYKPACTACQDCVPIRVPVDGFIYSSSQKKVYKKLKHLQAKVVELKPSKEHVLLYQEYQQARHAEGGMDKDGEKEYQEFLTCSFVDTQIVEYRSVSGGDKDMPIKKSEKQKLCMVSVMDVLEDGISAVYTYFDPTQKALSYGTYGILWQIEYARSLGLPYVYLGYWIPTCSKMSYKNNFKPFEIYKNGRWQGVDT